MSRRQTLIGWRSSAPETLLMYKEGRSKADYKEGEERAQEKLTTSGGARVKAGKSVLLRSRYFTF